MVTDARLRRAAVWVAGGLAVWALLLSWSLAIGRYGGPDEPAHITRAAAVAAGQVRGASAGDMPGGFRVVRVPASLASGDPACYRHDARRPATCADTGPRPGEASVATSAGINPPLYYALVGLPVRWLGQADDTTWYRVVATAWNALVLTLVAWRARRTAGRSAVLVVAALVTPASWFLFGVVNPNGMEIALLSLAWVSVPALLAAGRPGPAATWWVSLPAATAVAMRPIGVVAVVAIAVVVLAGPRMTSSWRWQHRLVLALPVLAAGVLVAAWNAWVALAFDDPRTADTRSRWRLLRESAGGTASTLREMVGSASWLEFSMPIVSRAVWWACAAGVLVAWWRRGRWGVLGGSPRASLVAWSLVVLAGPVVFETALAPRVGLIWQGRYTIPSLMGVAAFALALTGRADPELRRRLALVAPLVALAELAAFWTTLRRFTVGSTGSWWFREPATGRWDPIVPPLALLAAHGALLGAAAAASLYLTYPKRSMTTSVVPA